VRILTVKMRRNLPRKDRYSFTTKSATTFKYRSTSTGETADPTMSTPTGGSFYAHDAPKFEK
jgi:hypothetical protein